jgi:hypothetical protein
MANSCFTTSQFFCREFPFWLSAKDYFAMSLKSSRQKTELTTNSRFPAVNVFSGSECSDD